MLIPPGRNAQLSPRPSPALRERNRNIRSILVQSEVEDLKRELRAVQRKERWHFEWAMTGISPAALIPLIGLFHEGSFGVLLLLAILLTIFQFYLGGKAATRAHRLKREINRVRDKESSDCL